MEPLSWETWSTTSSYLKEAELWWLMISYGMTAIHQARNSCLRGPHCVPAQYSRMQATLPSPLTDVQSLHLPECRAYCKRLVTNNIWSDGSLNWKPPGCSTQWSKGHFHKAFLQSCAPLICTNMYVLCVHFLCAMVYSVSDIRRRVIMLEVIDCAKWFYPIITLPGGLSDSPQIP
jgi:hypothetical protein